MVTLITVLATFCLALHLAFWILCFARLFLHQDISANTEVPVSVIICAKNEFDNLKRNLPAILNQNYSNFELIIMDDHSTDNTQKLLQDLGANYSHLYHYKVIKNHPGKKQALREGVRHAKYDWLLLTDADCAPRSKDWIKTMMACTGDPAYSIVLGYGPLSKDRGWLNTWSRFETWLSALLYLSFAKAGFPYMGVGRNLLYKKELYLKANDVAGAHLASGDDDLFVNKAAHSGNTTICMDPDSFVYSDAQKSWKDYFEQKSRHLTTAAFYKSGDKIRLGLFALTHWGFYLLIPFLLLTGQYAPAAFLYFTRMLVCWPLAGGLLSRMKERDIIVYFPVLDFYLFIYYCIFSLAAIMPRQKKWK